MATIKKNLLLLCETAFISKDGKLNIIGQFNDVKAPSYPLNYPQLTIVSNVTIGTKGSYKQTIRLYNSETGKDVVPPMEFPLEVQEDKEKECGIIAQIVGVNIEEPGLFVVESKVDSEVIDSRQIKFLL